MMEAQAFTRFIPRIISSKYGNDRFTDFDRLKAGRQPVIICKQFIGFSKSRNGMSKADCEVDVARVEACLLLSPDWIFGKSVIVQTCRENYPLDAMYCQSIIIFE